MRKPDSLHPLSPCHLSQRMLAVLLSSVLAVSMCSLPSYADEGSATLEGAADAQVADDASALEAGAAETGADSANGALTGELDAQSDPVDLGLQADLQDQQGLRVIGDEGTARYSLQVENSTGFAIDGLEVKAS
ncbi:MAG: hypothetical protein ACI36T_05955, partial [Eggerthellaceae bacterium]